MITYVKSWIAKLLKEHFKQQVRIRVDDFESERDGRPVPQIELSVIYRGSNFNVADPISYLPQSQGIAVGSRTLAFDIVVRIKNLRSENAIQDFVDDVLGALTGAIIFQQPITPINDVPVGYDNGIWTYILSIGLTVPLGAEICENDWESLELAGVNIYLHVRDTPDDVQTLIVELKPDAAKG